VANQIQRTVLTSWINVLLICAPIGLCLHYVRSEILETFVVNYIALIPLWFMCDYALEQMEHYMSWTASTILDIFCFNTVQMISSFLLLLAKQIPVLQTSLVGGILNNILMVLGLSFFFGGMIEHQQQFNRVGALGFSSLLSIVVTSLLIPTAVKHLNQTTPENLVLQSRGVAFVLVFVYLASMTCQLVTHKDDYRRSGKSGHHGDPCSQDGNLHDSERIVLHPIPQAGRQTAASTVEPVLSGRAAAEQVEIKGPHLHFGVATSLFAVTIVLLYFCINATVDSISALTEKTALSHTFVGLILLPMPNADFAPISMAVDDNLEQTMKYTVWRSIQTALLVEPFVVLLSWWMGVGGVTLAFDGFEVVSLFTTILLLNFLVVDAQVYWIHGVLLLAEWVLIGIAAYFVTPELLK